MINIDIQVGDRVNEIGDGFFSELVGDYCSSHSKKWFDKFLKETDHLGEVILEDYELYKACINDIDRDRLIVEYISKNKELLIISHEMKGGAFKGRKLYTSVALEYCFIIDKCLEVNMKHRRLRNLEYLDI